MLDEQIESRLNENRNFAIINNDLDTIISTLEQKIRNNRFIVLQNDTFLIEDAKKAQKEAFIAEDKIKYIALVAKSFRVEAQNTLLKILEEPPKNIVFILITNSKSTFLPTVRSRLAILELNNKQEDFKLNFNVMRLDLKIVYEILQEHKYTPRVEVRRLIETIFKELVKNNVNLNEEDFEVFTKSIELLNVNSNNQFILSNILLRVLGIVYK